MVGTNARRTIVLGLVTAALVAASSASIGAAAVRAPAPKVVTIGDIAGLTGSPPLTGTALRAARSLPSSTSMLAADSRSARPVTSSHSTFATHRALQQTR